MPITYETRRFVEGVVNKKDSEVNMMKTQVQKLVERTEETDKLVEKLMRKCDELEKQIREL